MTSAEVLGRYHSRRSATEDFIRKTYALRYDATLTSFPENILALFNTQGRVICAAGVRDQSEAFFSERYLGAPIERALTELTGSEVSRNAIFEVSTLASQTPCSSAAFIREIVAYGEAQGFAWSFFTVTSRLQVLLGRIGVSSIYLGEALAERVANPGQWGQYYAARPRVCAVPGSRAITNARGVKRCVGFDAAAA
ncbi:thermostable hemolysin [Methylobacterium sp. NEAU K]|uniref:thermostable hemolysin n=1 Tax=Methylobacterium sp. NEAU K TaxID=3064946 RepID=UPI00273417FD|nr:thermostable hemolysin [Methylobacterium sp. NEAU K]MDP4006564.1 thermostable hemolysin [Methylobacterium sp. NEAU K]